MADNQKYYYMRLKDDFFDSEEMKLIEAMPDGYLYSNILLKLYLMSLKDNGRLCFKGAIPYSPEMVASITRHQVGTVKQALQIFQQMELVEILESGVIYMLNIQNFIGQSSTEADRKKAYRTRIENEKSTPALMDKCPEKCPDECPDISTPENRDKRIKIRDYNITPLPPLPKGGQPENKPDTQGRPGEGEQEEAKETPKPKKKAETAVPDYSRTGFSPAMIAKVNEWLDYKAEKRQRYKPTGLKSLIAQIEKQARRHGEATVIALIDDCMAANYQGIIWDKLERPGGKPTAQAGKSAAQLLGEMIEQDEMESGFPLYGGNYREVEEN